MKVTEVYRLVLAGLNKINLLRGGARSSKTHSMNQIAMQWLWTGEINGKVYEQITESGQVVYSNEGVFLIARPTMPALRRTVLREFENMLHNEKLMPYIKYSRTTHEFSYDGRMVAFMSLDEMSKILGMEPTYFWLNECNDIAYNIFQQMFLRTRFGCFLDYNPFDENGWINQELELKRLPKKGDVNLTISTFRMNPYLPPSMVEEIEYLEHTDKDLYDVYNLGNWATIKGLIYNNWEEVEALPSEGRRVLGLDFGFSHPAGLVEVVMVRNAIYIQELFYKRESLTSDIVDYLYTNGYNKHRIIADNARPEGIAEMKRGGLRVKASRKGKDSVRQGINNVKLYKIYVTKDSVNLIKELQRYKWNTDREENQQEEPIKMYDDLLDAVRYAVNYLHRGSSRIKIM